MADIIQFPGEKERDWRDMEQAFRTTYETVPQGIQALEDCLPRIKEAFDSIFVTVPVATSTSIPGPLRDDQVAAIRKAIDSTVESVSGVVKQERSRCFAIIAVLLFEASYYKLTGISLGAPFPKR